MEIYNHEYEYSQTLPDGVTLSSTQSEADRDHVCEHLIRYNIEHTSGLLKRPGLDLNLILRDGEKLIGAILCDTYLMTAYIDVLWVDEAYRGKGYGRILMEKVEQIAREQGCVLLHTCTFSYQAPDFYRACGYEVFAELHDFPDAIVQYFLKKKL